MFYENVYGGVVFIKFFMLFFFVSPFKYSVLHDVVL